MWEAIGELKFFFSSRTEDMRETNFKVIDFRDGDDARGSLNMEGAAAEEAPVGLRPLGLSARRSPAGQRVVAGLAFAQSCAHLG